MGSYSLKGISLQFELAVVTKGIVLAYTSNIQLVGFNLGSTLHISCANIMQAGNYIKHVENNTLAQ